MPIKQALSFSIIFIILNLIQKSFLTHFVFYQSSLNLVLITVFFVSFLTAPKNKQSVFILSFIAGLSCDIFSVLPFGVFTLGLFLSSFFIFFLSEFLKKESIASFASLFILFFISFKVIFQVLIFSLDRIFKNNTLYFLSFSFKSVLGELFLNLCFAVIVFFAIKKLCLRKR